MKVQAQLYWGLGQTVGSATPGFVASVLLPHKTPLHHPVSGEPRPSKKLARASAALQVVRLLHQEGELDSSLRVRRRKRAEVPVETLVSSGTVSGEKTVSGGEAVGRRRWHLQLPPPQLSLRPGEPLVCLHILSLRLVYFKFLYTFIPKYCT